MTEITIKDVAKACGVGVSTVSRAINNHPNINEQTKELVLKKIQELGYVPNNSARNLKRTEGKAVAVLVKGMNNPFFSLMIKIMEEDIISRGYTMVLQHVDPAEDETDVALELMKEKRLSGIIFLGGIVTHTSEKLSLLTVPYVLSTIGAPLLDVAENSYSSVAVDDAKEGKKATELLISKGCKRIAIFAGAVNDTSVGMLRLNGYKEALKEAGLPVETELIRYLSPENEEYSYETGFISANKLIEEKVEFDAIFAIADVMAVGVLKALHNHNIRIPEDVQVVGFDGIELSKYCIPSLTTVAQPLEEIAIETSHLLFDVMDGSKEHRHLVLEGEIVERETTK